MSSEGHDHRDSVYTMYSRVPRAASRLLGSDRQASLYIWNFLIFGLPLWAIYNYGFFLRIVIAHPGAGEAVTGIGRPARAERMASSAVLPLRRPVATIEQMSA